MSESFVHPALIFMVGALLLPLVRGSFFRQPYLILVPVLGLLAVLSNGAHHGDFGGVQFLDWQLSFGRVDRLSQVFAFIMGLMAIIGTLYGLQVKRSVEHIAAWFYVAGSLGVIYAGDYLTLFLFWEMMAFASTFLIWFRNRAGSLACGYRYLLVHSFGGIVLLAGIMLNYQATGSIAFTQLDVSQPTLAVWLIAIGFLLNAAAVPLHSWLPDAYAEASFNGAVFMCAFTTKTAVYTLARGLSGFEILIPVGVVMALYGVVYAILENDIRRLLAWSIISQVGYMVAGVGIGTELAINGACAHAFAHILYKGLLFMGTGAILYRTGITKFTELGGLYKKMPVTPLLTLVGCLAISAAPFFSGFVSKSMIISAGFETHRAWAALLLMLAATGTFIYNGLKLPYYVWFGQNRCSAETWERASEPPWNMQMAMVAAAVLCILVGSAPSLLYGMLPHPVDYHPYTGYHMAETLQLMGFAALGFFLLRRWLEPRDTVSLDLDRFYRAGGRAFLWVAQRPLQWFDTAWGETYRVVGLGSLMTMATFWSWFDWHGIDTVVDGIARGVRNVGGRLRLVQAGQVQTTLYLALIFAGVLIFALALSRFV